MHYANYQTCAVRPQVPLSEWNILSSLPTALVIINSKGCIVWLNPMAESMLGYGLLGSRWLDVLSRAFVPKPDDGHEVSLANGRRVQVSLATLESLPGILISLTDVTATRDYEKAREHEKRLMTIGTMTAQLAHQIRTPLASAILYTEHLTSHLKEDGRAQNWLSRIQECYKSIERQIQDLLLFARGTTIVPALMDMDYWCSQLLLRAQPYLDARGIQFEISNQLKYSQAVIHGESLIGAVLNLIINAIQSEAKKIILNLLETDDFGVQITVEDDGKGMSDEIRSQAFTPFFTTKARGTGLGLAVVFAVIKAHNGYVDIQSQEGAGTEVHLFIPSCQKQINEDLK